MKNIIKEALIEASENVEITEKYKLRLLIKILTEFLMRNQN